MQEDSWKTREYGWNTAGIRLEVEDSVPAGGRRQSHYIALGESGVDSRRRLARAESEYTTAAPEEPHEPRRH